MASASIPPDCDVSRRLGRYVRLSEAELTAIRTGFQGPLRTSTPRREMVRQGGVPGHARLIVEGWACRRRTLPDGRQQITSLHLPGDIFGLDFLHATTAEDSVVALSQLNYVELPNERIRQMIVKHPAVGHAFWAHSLVADAVQRAWTANIGLRSASERLAHFFCEIFARLRAIGRLMHDRCEMPLTQCELAEATGLTSVHAIERYRNCAAPRRAGLVQIRSRELRIPDIAKLEHLALFDPAYLRIMNKGEKIADQQTNICYLVSR
jgi:CRP-like cAMP-binding protein